MRFTICDLRFRIGVPDQRPALRFAATLLSVTALITSLGQAETLLLTDATIHTVSGATIVRGDVLIQDGKIKGVFDASLPSRQIYPPDATKIDLKGLHLYPGMI